MNSSWGFPNPQLLHTPIGAPEFGCADFLLSKKAEELLFIMGKKLYLCTRIYESKQERMKKK